MDLNMAEKAFVLCGKDAFHGVRLVKRLSNISDRRVSKNATPLRVVYFVVFAVCHNLDAGKERSFMGRQCRIRGTLSRVLVASTGHNRYT